MTVSAKKDDRPRQSIRLRPEMWGAIDDARAKRPGVVSRNTWIAEAILEKLAREQDTRAPPSKTRSGYV
jgi:metal-responsive CopG/Arc/MetJ family transcriptional regulator